MAKVLVPQEGESLMAFVARNKATLTYVPANPHMFRSHFAEVWSPGSKKEKEQWINAHIGVDSHWTIAGIWWYFDNASDASWFKLSF